MGATGFGFEVVEVLAVRSSLPLCARTLVESSRRGAINGLYKELAGVSPMVTARCGGAEFARKGFYFTHVGLSGPRNSAKPLPTGIGVLPIP